jgi:FKBP-type peptidyl-prolyl cis-trans isomerase 2
MKIVKGRCVKLEYEISVDGGEVVESSDDRGPLEYVHGSGRMLAAIEDAILSLEPGDEKSGVIPAAQAYGTTTHLPTRIVPKGEFPGNEKPVANKTYSAKDATGKEVAFTVVDVADDSVTVRFNHPLAGKNIAYRIKVVDVTDPPAPPPLPKG